ncbi:putative glycosyl transferase [Mariannaea sp. PMI_226]|nr:putative glycosyl transferase [Mariannaea sp. PMI_226]
MQKSTSPQRPHSIHLTKLLPLVIFFTIVILLYSHDLVYKSWTLAVLPFTWRMSNATFILSDADDAFDITFSNYSRETLTASPYDDVVPPILHHIALGMSEKDWVDRKDTWGESVQSCKDMHPGWQTYMWTDEKAEEFVAQRFPQVLDIWKSYRYPVQRIDALRYMVLYEYGGVILDMDLKCTRGLGPLRRFQFVAPEAHPVGFSIGFMMASKQNPFVRDLVDNLSRYDVHWLGLPYVTVMFSTGCHYASVIHKHQSNRGDLKILPGPLHSLNGHVSTPIFEHLGSSSWHSYDAGCITALGKMPLHFVIVLLCAVLVLCVRRRRIVRHVKCTLNSLV